MGILQIRKIFKTWIISRENKIFEGNNHRTVSDPAGNMQWKQQARWLMRYQALYHGLSGSGREGERWKTQSLPTVPWKFQLFLKKIFTH